MYRDNIYNIAVNIYIYNIYIYIYIYQHIYEYKSHIGIFSFVCIYIYILSMPANSCIVLHMSQHVALPSHFSYACCLGSQGALDAAQGYLRTTRIATWRKNNYLPCINFVCDLWEGSGVCLWGVPGISYLLGWPLPLPDRYIYNFNFPEVNHGFMVVA